LEVDGSDESLLSEETSAENAWPRSQTAVGGRPGTVTETGTFHIHQPRREGSGGVARKEVS
jgi:hypothetical protein